MIISEKQIIQLMIYLTDSLDGKITPVEMDEAYWLLNDISNQQTVSEELKEIK
jgi:hypothetical protein